MLSAPVVGSTVTPSPATLKVSAAPVKFEKAFTKCTPEFWKSMKSAKRPADSGGKWVTTTEGLSALAEPAALTAATAQASVARSSVGPGTYVAPVAPGIACPSRTHCRAIAGAG